MDSYCETYCAEISTNNMEHNSEVNRMKVQKWSKVKIKKYDYIYVTVVVSIYL